MLKEWLKIKWKYLKGLLIAYREREDIKLTKKKQAYVMLAANYNNLGDIAITKAQEEFLKHNLSNDYEIIVVPHDKTYQKYLSIKKYANKDTIITLIGGGNSGSLYEFIEEPRRFILKFFKKYKIVSFPQSIVYEKQKIIYQKEFVKLCKKCTNLTLIAREQISYKRYNKLLGKSAKILLTPDIVFTLNVNIEDKKRCGASYIFRNDKEKDISDGTQKKLINICDELYSDRSFNDTCDVRIKENGYTELKRFISDISKRELVVTDRLHGMILSYISNTPCIALDNNNHKIKSTYETWLNNQTLIFMSNDLEQINEYLKEKTVGQREEMDVQFEALRNILCK